jgi:hypothetical protein
VRADRQPGVDLVPEPPAHNRAAELVDNDLAGAMVAGHRDEGRHPLELLHQLLVALAGVPGKARGEQPGMCRGALEQEAVAVLDVLEDVGDAALDLAAPALDRLVVDAQHDVGGMNAQVLAHRRAADPAAEQ